MSCDVLRLRIKSTVKLLELVINLGEQVVQGKKWIYAFTAIILVLCIGFTVFFVFFNPEATIQESIAVKGPVLTDEQAIKIAMPSIEQYASENNRTIKSVNATFYNSTSTKGAAWEVFARFDLVREPAAQHWINGYTVSIWANNGEISYAKESEYY